MGIVVGWMVCAWWAMGVFAQEPVPSSPKPELTPFQQRLAEAATPTETNAVSVSSALIRVVVALLIVVGVVAGLAYGFRRMSPRFLNTSDGVVRVLAQVPLGPSQFLSVVDIAGTVVVLGVTDHNVTALSEIEDAAVANRLRQNASSRLLTPLPGSFKQWLRRAQQGEVDR